MAVRCRNGGDRHCLEITRCHALRPSALGQRVGDDMNASAMRASASARAVGRVSLARGRIQRSTAPGRFAVALMARSCLSISSSSCVEELSR
jgi:hypothetical protein